MEAGPKTPPSLKGYFQLRNVQDPVNIDPVKEPPTQKNHEEPMFQTAGLVELKTPLRYESILEELIIADLEFLGSCWFWVTAFAGDFAFEGTLPSGCRRCARRQPPALKW